MRLDRNKSWQNLEDGKKWYDAVNLVRDNVIKPWKTFWGNDQTNNFGFQKWDFSICDNKLFQIATFLHIPNQILPNISSILRYKNK